MSSDPFDLFKAYFLSWFMPLLLCVGFWGTLVNLVIILRCPVFQKTTAVLFSALAVADLVNLVFAASYLYLSVYWDVDPMQLSPAGCLLVPYLEAIGYWLSPWIQAAISFHRMLAIRYPLKVRHWLTVRRTRAILGTLSALVAGYALVIPACHTWQSSLTNPALTVNSTNFPASNFHPCDKEGHKFLVYYSHGLFGSIVPFFVMVICTGVIVYLVCQSRRDVASTLEQLSAKQTRALRTAHRVAAAAGRSRAHNSASSGGGGSGGKTGGKPGGEKRVTLVLVLMNLTYFLTNGFAGLFLISKVHLTSGSGESDFARLWATLHRFADVCACLNNSTNWIFYLLTGKKFREQFLRVICCHSDLQQPQQPQQPQEPQQQIARQLLEEPLLAPALSNRPNRNGGEKFFQLQILDVLDARNSEIQLVVPSSLSADYISTV